MLPTDLFTEFYESSFKTTFLACREASKLMLPQRAGRIITIGSTMTIVHEPGTAAYSANKAAIVEFTKVLARELAAHNITCNTIAPSLMNTPSSEAMGEEWRGRMLAMQTIRRPVEIAEIGGIVEFLASPQAACLTGQVLSTCFVS
jgi:3-oxoacyl-[acyl-carrier protein] reductase